MGKGHTPYDVDLYSILGVARTASLEELEKAYHAGCKEHHPDKGGAEGGFNEIGMGGAPRPHQESRLRQIEPPRGAVSGSRFASKWPTYKWDQPPKGAAGEHPGSNEKGGRKGVRELPQDRSNTALGWQKDPQKISSGFSGKWWLGGVLVAARSSVPTTEVRSQCY